MSGAQNTNLLLTNYVNLGGLLYLSVFRLPSLKYGDNYGVWRRKWQPPPEFLPREPHGQRSLEGPWGHKELDTT